MNIRGLLRRLKAGQFSMIPAELNPNAQTASNRTRMDRYPAVFQEAADRKPNARRVLSYGCSTGEECATLAKYFPGAQIVGTDINWLNLKSARKKWPEFRFVKPDDQELQSLKPFDVITCMNVLRIQKHYYNRKSGGINSVYPFSRFEQQIQSLDDLIAVGGILALVGTSYRFCDTSTYKLYQPVEQVRGALRRNDYHFPDGALADGYPDILFMKQG